MLLRSRGPILLRADNEWEGTHPIVKPVMSHRTLNIEALVTDNRERILATRELLMEHFQSFGLAEVPQIGPGGQLRIAYWQNGNVPTGWNGRVGVPESKATLDDDQD